ncbi:MAG: hypothetical protein AB8B89_05015 [Gammaproteobacteria bacterium]
MVKNIYIATVLIVILLASMLPAHSDQTEFKELIIRINTINLLIDQAKNTNSLWRETKNLSDSAKKYVDIENYTIAKEAIIEAEFQAKLGIQQALEQTDINKLIPSYLQH